MISVMLMEKLGCDNTVGSAPCAIAASVIRRAAIYRSQFDQLQPAFMGTKPVRFSCGCGVVVLGKLTLF